MWYAVTDASNGNELVFLTETPSFFTGAPFNVTPLNRDDRPDPHTEQWDKASLGFKPVVRRALTKVEFLELFTPAERKNIRRIRNASEDLDGYLYLLEQATEVNLDSANTQAGINMLERDGLIAPGRAAEILGS